jgi:adenine-specific DNA-methyltransferase
VLSNDLATYSEPLGQAYIAADGQVDRARVRRLLADLSALPPAPGYFTKTFCEDARYFQPHNGARIDAIRPAIDELDVDPIERGLLLTSLLEAADRVDSTTGLQMAYLKTWAPRAYNDLELREPKAVDGPAGSVERRDANELAGSLDVELVYIDPPYNQHKYFGNYHVWETLVRWDCPETYGIANKRIDCRDERSDYNSKRRASAVFDDLLNRLDVPWMLVSFNNEGYHDPTHVYERLAAHGYVNFVEVDFKRYVGAQIGIYNPSGEKVGAISHLRNKEVLFVVGPDRELVDSIFDGRAIGDAAVAATGQAALF